MTNASGSLAVLRERYGERYRWLLLLSVMVGTMASIMSSTIVNVAIPDMSHYFALGQERAQWVTSGFMVATTVSMLLRGIERACSNCSSVKTMPLMRSPPFP